MNKLNSRPTYIYCIMCIVLYKHNTKCYYFFLFFTDHVPPYMSNIVKLMLQTDQHKVRIFITMNMLITCFVIMLCKFCIHMSQVLGLI